MPSQTGKWKSGRIQNLTADQEVIAKQTWGYLLKYWGYQLSIADEDLAYKECFIASTSTSENDSESVNGLARSTTRNSIGSTTSHKTSTSTLMSKKRRGLFGGGKKAGAPAVAPAAPPPESKRMKQIQTKSSSERYSPVDEPSESTLAAYRDYYKLTWDSDSGDESDDDDNASMETFVTASTSLTEPEEVVSHHPIPKGGSPYTKNGITHPSSNGSFKSRPSNGYASRSSSISRAQPPPVAQPTQPKRSTSTSLPSRIKITPNPGIIPVMAKYKPSDIHRGLIDASRLESPDSLVLRYIRARKWNSENALAMLTKSVNWRVNELPADKWVMEGDAKSYVQGINKGFIKNLTTEKAWIRGHDKNNNPIFFFLARKHFGSDSPSAESQRYAVTFIEWCRFFLEEGPGASDEVSIVFDLTGFSLKNADYETIKFLADVFEAHYPECLGSILIYNAPWIFSTVWNLIKNWLDPVVASKIHFTKNFKEISDFIDPVYLPTDFGGEDTTYPHYPIPTEKDVYPPCKKDAKYRALRRERDQLYMKFLETTVRWVESTNPVVSEKYFQDKLNLGAQLGKNYKQLDCYLRSPGVFDRMGVLNIQNC